MYLTTFVIVSLKCMEWILLIFFCTKISMTSSLKKTKVRLDLLTNINMLLMIEKGISGGICHSIHQYAKANNKYMKKKIVMY